MKARAAELEIEIEWGGDWRSFKDCPHFQVSNWRNVRSIADRIHNAKARIAVKELERRVPESPYKWVRLVDEAAYYGIPESTIRTLARDPVRGAYSSLGDIELRYLDREKLWTVDFHQFAWWAKHGGYRCEPIAGLSEPEELVALNPDYILKAQIIESYPDIPKSYIGHWIRFREKFGLSDIITRNGKVLFAHREKFRERVLANRSWASKEAREEVNASVMKYRIAG